MKDLLHLVENRGCFLILPIRDFSMSDFRPVSERPNSVQFIFDDDPWEIDSDNSFVFKIRFVWAKELDKMIREKVAKKEIKLNEMQWAALSEICKVRRSNVSHEENKAMAEKDLYLKAIEEVSKAVIDFGSAGMIGGLS